MVGYHGGCLILLYFDNRYRCSINGCHVREVSCFDKVELNAAESACVQKFGGTNEGFSRQEQCHDVDLAFLRDELRCATKR